MSDINSSNFVGFLTVDAVEKYHKTFEYAGAGEIWQLDAAVVPIFKNGHLWFTGSRPGTRIDSWFQSRIGACLGDDNRDTEPMDGKVGMQFDAFGCGKLAAEGMLELSDNYKLVKLGKYSDGKTIYRIEKVG